MIGKRHLCWALCIISVPLQVFAIGLGGLTVKSNLYQPLQATIVITDVGDIQLSSLTAHLASATQYQQQHIEYPDFLPPLTMTIKKIGQHDALLELTSNANISTPYINLLIELSTPSDKILYPYTVLLDPNNQDSANNNVDNAISKAIVVTDDSSNTDPSTVINTALADNAGATVISRDSGTALNTVNPAAPYAPSADDSLQEKNLKVELTITAEALNIAKSDNQLLTLKLQALDKDNQTLQQLLTATKQDLTQLTAHQMAAVQSNIPFLSNLKAWQLSIIGLIILFCGWLLSYFFYKRRFNKGLGVESLKIAPNNPPTAPSEHTAMVVVSSSDNLPTKKTSELTLTSALNTAIPSSQYNVTELLQDVETYLTYGRITQAVNTIKMALTRDEKNPLLWQRLLDIYAEMGEKVEFDATCQAIPSALIEGLSKKIQQLQAVFAEEPLGEEKNTSTKKPAHCAEKMKHQDITIEEFDEDATAAEEEPLAFEVDTESLASKLDLARAYIDMGDQKSAAKILQKVMRGNDEELKRQATILLAKSKNQ